MQHLSSYKQVHIVGIGGAGMSAIARVLHARGHIITGSDRQESPTVAALLSEGLAIVIGHAPENIGSADLVLTSSAIAQQNPELAAARARGIPVLERAEFFPLLTAEYDVIAVAGAHGKTTVTGMIATILLEANYDPSFIIGGIPGNLGTNARSGEGRYFVIEADEYRHTFHAFAPRIAVVTNIQYDHPDVFPSLRFLRLAFGDFVDRIQPGGLLIASNDDRVAHLVAASFHANGGRLALYGIEEGVGLAYRALNIRPNNLGGIDFEAQYEGQAILPIRLQVPGAHNALNALAALSVAEEIGIPWNQAALSLLHFKGTQRRFEVLGESGGITVIDDYAHHPIQIQAVLQAAQQRYPDARLRVVWQPHTFSRVRALWDEFLDAFEGAANVLVLPIYAAREVDDGTLTHTMLAEALTHSAVSVAHTLDEATHHLAETVVPGDVILLMGAGDEYRVGHDLLARLQEQEGNT